MFVCTYTQYSADKSVHQISSNEASTLLLAARTSQEEEAARKHVDKNLHGMCASTPVMTVMPIAPIYVDPCVPSLIVWQRTFISFAQMSGRNVQKSSQPVERLAGPYWKGAESHAESAVNTFTGVVEPVPGYFGHFVQPRSKPR